MSTFDGSKVNGLANALQSQMAASNPLNSPEFFDYIQENYANTFRDEIMRHLDSEYVKTALNTNACRSFTVKVPSYSYDATAGTWSEKAMPGDLPLVMCFNASDDSSSGDVIILFGNYAFQLAVSIEHDSEMDRDLVVVGDPVWYKVSLN